MSCTTPTALGARLNATFPYAFRYRDYVIDSFNKDKPYNRFVGEQIAGDLLPARTVEERRENLTATGFLTLSASRSHGARRTTHHGSRR